MALTQYARSTLFFDGVELEHITSLEHKTNGGWVPVKTLKKGLSGFSPTGGHVEIRVGVAIPIGGPEAEFQPKCINGETVTLQMPIGSKDYIGEGQIMNADFSQSTDKELIGSFDWMGEVAPLQ